MRYVKMCLLTKRWRRGRERGREGGREGGREVKRGREGSKERERERDVEKCTCTSFKFSLRLKSYH